MLEETVITATRTPTRLFDAPRLLTVIRLEELRRRGAMSLVDVLDDRIGVWIEKRTSTTSDPVIRGFAGGSLLALIDGSSLSTKWGEGGFAGDDLYGKVDADSIGRIEVVRGPSAVLYGSNTLGGVVQFFTKDPSLDFAEGPWRYGAWTKASFTSAASERHVRQEIHGAGADLRFIAGASWREAGDVRRGRGGEQAPTGGREANWDAKVEQRLGPHRRLLIAVQDVARDPVYRYYRPSQDNRNDREGFSITYDSKAAGGILDRFLARVYYQDKRDRRRFLDTGKSGIAITRTSSADLQVERYAGAAHHLTAGLHWDLDDGESPDDEQFTITDPDGTRHKDAPDSRWQGAGVFVQDEWAVSESWILTASARADRFRFETEVDPAYDPPGSFDPRIDEVSHRKDALTGGLGLVFHASDRLNLFADWSRGYRMFAPKFGFTQHGYGVVIPGGLLDPVTADAFEAGIKWQGSALQTSLGAYYTHLENFQETIPATYQGQDWFDFNGNGQEDASEKTFRVAGKGRAFVYGTELEFQLRPDAIFASLDSRWTIHGGFMWNYGRSLGGTREPLRHTHPARGIIKLRWEDESSARDPWFEVGADLVRRYDRIPPSRLSGDVGYRVDPQDSKSPLVRPWGLPGYTVFHAAAGFRPRPSLELAIYLGNLGDKRYRRAHSRWDEPGFDARLTVAWTQRF